MTPYISKLPHFLRQALINIQWTFKYVLSFGLSSAPPWLKRIILKADTDKNMTFIETGTYFGDTTLFLSKNFSKVISIEPEKTIYAFALKRLKKHTNVSLYNGSSEEVFETILSKEKGNICFFLDGHYSDGVTFLGEEFSPMKEELRLISKYKNNFKICKIIVDDFRLFGQTKTPTNYPDRMFLVNFAENEGLDWEIKADMFIMQNKASII